MQLTDNQNLQTMKTAEEKAMELYTDWEAHSKKIDSLGVIVVMAEREAFLKGYEYANQQPEQGKVREVLQDDLDFMIGLLEDKTNPLPEAVRSTIRFRTIELEKALK